MRYAPLVDRIGPQDDGSGPEAWGIHYQAVADAAAGRLVNGREVIVMSVGDPDLDTPAPIRAAAAAAMEAGDTHYTPVPGRPALRAAVAQRFAERVPGDWGAENVMITAGAQCALFCASLCVAGAGDEIVAFEPMYVSYPATVRVSGARITRAACPADGRFRPTRAALEAALTDRTRAILVASPNNPTGVMLTEEELSAIASVAIERDLWVISDEVYAQIGFERPHLSIAALPGMAERTVTVDSLSKSHAMTGWRIGWAIGPAEMIGHFDNLGLCMLYGLPGFNQAAALTALGDEAWGAAAEMREIYRGRRDRFARAVNQVPGLVCDPPEGGMFGLVDVRGTGLSAAAFAERLYPAEGVSVLDGAVFGPSADGFARISFAVSEAAMDEACRRMARFVASL